MELHQTKKLLLSKKKKKKRKKNHKQNKKATGRMGLQIYLQIIPPLRS